MFIAVPKSNFFRNFAWSIPLYKVKAAYFDTRPSKDCEYTSSHAGPGRVGGPLLFRFAFCIMKRWPLARTTQFLSRSTRALACSVWSDEGFPLSLNGEASARVPVFRQGAEHCTRGRVRSPQQLNRYGWGTARQILVAMALCFFLAGSSQAQLFQNLQSLAQSIPVGSGEIDPGSGERADGPRWVGAADFDLDGNQDFATCHLNGEIWVGWGRGDGSFEGPERFPSGTSNLRAIITGDFNGDGRPDLAAAAPYDGVVTLLFSTLDRGFAAPSLVTTFKRGRNLEAGDFDGDGILDLAVAGPDEVVQGTNNTNQVITGVLHLRGTGAGAFVKMGTVPEVGLPHLDGSKLKPVFSLESFRRLSETKDTLAVTHEQSPAIWLLRTGTNGVLQVAHALSWFGNQPADSNASPYAVDSLKVGTVFAPAVTRQMDLIAVMQQA